MAAIFTTVCYDLIDCLLWGALMFCIGAELATSNNKNNKTTNKKKARKQK